MSSVFWTDLLSWVVTDDNGMYSFMLFMSAQKLPSGILRTPWRLCATSADELWRIGSDQYWVFYTYSQTSFSAYALCLFIGDVDAGLVRSNLAKL